MARLATLLALWLIVLGATAAGPPRTGVIGGAGSGGGGASASFGEDPPVGDCSGSDTCMHFTTDSGGTVVLGILCAVENEPYAPCYPQVATADPGTASPNGSLTCDSDLCLYPETDASTWWISWTPGNSGWMAIGTGRPRHRYKFYFATWDTATDSGRCADDDAGTTPIVCGSIGNTATDNLRFRGFPIPRAGARVRRVSCTPTLMTGFAAGDSVSIQVQERNGVDNTAFVAGTATVVLDTSTLGVEVAVTPDAPFTLTSGDFELRMTGTDANSSITAFTGTCYVEVES